MVCPAPDRRPGRRRPRGVVEHRQRRGPGRGPAGPDRRPGPVRRRRTSSASTSTCWRHTRRGDKYVTVIIDLTPIRDGTGPARLLDMVEGRSKQAFKTWLADRAAGLARRGRGRRDGRVHRVQDRHHRGAARRGRGDGPLPRRPPGRRRPGPVPPPGPAGHSTATAAAPATRSTAPAGPCTPAPTCSPTSRRDRLEALFAADEHVEVEATWGIYQRMIAAYREPDRARGRELMSKLIDVAQPRRPRRADRARHARPHPEAASRRRAGLLRPARHQQRPDRGDQRPPRTPPRLRPRLPQPHQLHRPITPRDRRIQTPTTPSIVKSPLTRS